MSALPEVRITRKKQRSLDLGAAFIQGILAHGVALDLQKDGEISGGYKPRREAGDSDFTHTVFTLLKANLADNGAKGDLASIARLAMGSVVRQVAGENTAVLGSPVILLQKDRVLAIS